VRALPQQKPASPDAITSPLPSRPILSTPPVSFFPTLFTHPRRRLDPDGFRRLSPSILVELLQQNDIPIGEKAIFDMMLDWVSAGGTHEGGARVCVRVCVCVCVCVCVWTHEGEKEGRMGKARGVSGSVQWNHEWRRRGERGGWQEGFKGGCTAYEGGAGPAQLSTWDQRLPST
jgi:hypothetical protein